MAKNTHTLRRLKSQKHIDRVLYNLNIYIAQYRVPQPQLLREATAQLIAGNLGPRNAFYHDIQNEIYWLIHRQVEYLINLEIQQEQELHALQKKMQKHTPRHPLPPQKSKAPIFHIKSASFAPHNTSSLKSLNSSNSLKTLNSLTSQSHHPPPLAKQYKPSAQ